MCLYFILHSFYIKPIPCKPNCKNGEGIFPMEKNVFDLITLQQLLIAVIMPGGISTAETQSD